MRNAVLITMCTVLLAAVGPAAATATYAPILDGDFAGGAFAGTHVFGGDLYIDETIWENQDFAASPIGLTWTATPWPSGGSATVDGGALQVDGALVGTDRAFDGPQSLRFPATFSGQAFQHVGVGADFDAGPYAIFSTGGGDLPVGLYARTRAGATAIDVPVAGIDPTVYHSYEIRWTAGQVTFYVDGGLVSTQDIVLPNGLRILASDYDADGGAVRVDGVRLQNFVATGSFVSRPLATGPGLTAWGALIAGGDVAGAGFETRTGRTPAPDGSWSPWQALGPGGAVQSPLAGYVQYRATLSSLGGVYGARVTDVLIGLDADRAAPITRISGLSVGRSTVRFAFASPDADVTRFECKLDGGAYATCASPKSFAGLAARSHTVAVRAIDRVANEGPADTRTFVVRKPVGPRISLSPRSVRISSRGRVAFRVACPKSARRCRVGVGLERGRKAVSSKKTVSVRGGKTLKVTLRMNKATRKYLSRHARLRVTAVTVARDAAGNRRTKRFKVTLRAPRR